MAALYALEMSSQSAAQRAGQAQVQSQQDAAKAAFAKQRAAEEREKHDSGGKGFFACIGNLIKDITADLAEFKFGDLARDVHADGDACDNAQFWSDLELGAKVVAAIAAVAATVVSCGTLGPVVVGVAIALSAAGFVVQQTHCCGKASAWVGLGLQLAAAVVTCGASLSATAASASTTLLQTAGTAATATSASADAVAGTAHVEISGYQADSLQTRSQATQAEQNVRLANQLEQWAIESLQEQAESHQNALKALSGAMQTDQQASLLAAARLGRG